MEHNGLIHAVQELRTEMPPQLFEHRFLHPPVAFAGVRTLIFQDAGTADVRRHDDDGILEVHGAALPVGEPSVIQNLQQNVEHVVMRLFDFVEQDDAVRTAPNRFRELAAFIIPHISGGRADQARHGVLLLILRHIDADHGALVVEKVFGQGPGQLGFTDAGGSQENKAPDRPVRIFQAGTRAHHRLGHGHHGFVLPDHALMQDVFKLQELAHLPFQQLRNRYAGPTADHSRDVFLVHLFFQQTGAGLLLGELGLFLGQLPLQTGHGAVLQLSGAVQVVLALGLVDVDLHLLQLFAQPAQPLDAFFFGLPLGLQGAGTALQVGQFFLQLLQALFRGRVGLLLQCLALDFKLHAAPQNFVQFGGHGIDFGAQLGARFVHQIDGFVGEEAVGDVAIRENRGGHQGGILDAHPMVDFVAFAQPAQDGNGVLHRGLIHQDGLEAALEGGVFLDMPAVFVQRGGSDAMQLAARQHGFEEIAGVHGAFGLARAHHGVQLIDEEDDFAVGGLHLFQHGFETLLEFAAKFRAGDQGAHVERDHATFFQALGHVAADDALRKSLHDGRLADSRLADQNGIVLGAARQHLDYPADLFIAADHRIELAFFGLLGEIPAVLFERFVGGFGIGGGDALAAADVLQGAHEAFARKAEFLEQAPGGAWIAG